MAYSIIVQRRASLDLDEAFIFLHEMAPEAAVRWYSRMKGEIRTLADMPGRCALAPEAASLGLELRQLVVGKRTGRYRVIFRIVEERREVQVLAVRHGAR